MSLSETERQAIEAFEKEAGVNVVRPRVPRKVKHKKRPNGAASSAARDMRKSEEITARMLERREIRAKRKAENEARAEDAAGYCIELGFSMQEAVDATGASHDYLKAALDAARAAGVNMSAYDAGKERARAASVMKQARKRMGIDDDAPLVPLATTPTKDPNAVSLGKRGAAARNASVAPERRAEIARAAARARWDGGNDD